MFTKSYAAFTSSSFDSKKKLKKPQNYGNKMKIIHECVDHYVYKIIYSEENCKLHVCMKCLLLDIKNNEQ